MVSAGSSNAVSISGLATQARTALDDTYTGGSGVDVLTATTGIAGGADKFVGGGGHDTLVLGSAGNTGIGAIGVERIIGSTSADGMYIQTLTGETTYFWGKGGGDVLNLHEFLGGASNGGSIRVIFKATSELTSNTSFTGFNFATDKLIFDESFRGTNTVGSTGLSATAGNVVAGAGAGGAGAPNRSDADDYWAYNTGENKLYFDPDGSGAGSGASFVAAFLNPVGTIDSTTIAAAIKYVDSTLLDTYLTSQLSGSPVEPTALVISA